MHGLVDFVILQVFVVFMTLVVSIPGYKIYPNKIPPVIEPHFDPYNLRHIEAKAGETILFPCVVHNLREKVVSWIRSKDLQILTSGAITFTGDNRFEPVHPEREEFWGLRVRGVHISDTGQYECQVSTDPKLSLAINLTVSGDQKFEYTNGTWISQALIKGGPREIFVNDGSRLIIVCEVFPLARPAEPQDTDPVNELSSDHRVEDEVRWLFQNAEITEILEDPPDVTKVVNSHNHIVTTLSVERVTGQNSGQYTCLPTSGKADYVMVNVIEDERPEAMQGDFPVSSFSITTSTNLLILFFVNTLYLL